MKKWMTALGVASLTIGGAVMMLPADARGSQLDVLTLRGAGSSIGVTVREATADDAGKAKLGEPHGAVIESVTTNSPASRAGFQAGDIVVEFDGERVRGVQHFTRLVQETPPRRTVNAIVVRGTARQTLRVEPEAMGSFTADRLRSQLDLRRRVIPELRDNLNFNVAPDLLRRRGLLSGPSTLGVSVTELTPQLAEYFGVEQGVLVASVLAGTPGAEAGLRAGDVLTAIGGQRVSTPAEAIAALRRVQPGEGVDINVTRDRKSLMLKATIAARPAASGRGGLTI